MNVYDGDELSIGKIIIIDTCRFHRKGEFCVTSDYSRIEVDLFYRKKKSMSFYKMVSRDSANSLDCKRSLRSRNSYYQRILPVYY